MNPRFTCDSGTPTGISPPMNWSGEPAGTQSFALIMEDIGGDSGAAPLLAQEPYLHWLLWDIPGSVHSLDENAKGVGVMGKEYEGPCPPGGGPHTYVFHLFALDLPSVNLKRGKGRDALESAMRKHVLAKTEFQMMYGR